MLVEEAVAALDDAGIETLTHGDPATAFDDVVHHSGQVTAGALFCCVPGARVDGHDLADDAIAAGAVALLVERRLPVDERIAQILVPSVRHAMGPVAARRHGDPSRSMEVIGVTGTNGKTTTVALLQSVLTTAGRRCEIIGTLTSSGDGPPTTPDAPELQALLGRWRDEGIDTVAMEVSSHALAMGRVAGTWFAVTAFTTLGHDHLDHHETMDDYFEAKASLFTPERTARAVIRRDDEWGARLIERVEATAVEVRTFALEDAERIEARPDGTTFRIGETSIDLPLPGTHNVANALTARAIAQWLGVDEATIAAGLAATPVVAGRFERVDEGQLFTVVVDYAHTPDALAVVLDAARGLAGDTGRVIVVFGCGGDKDRAKRPEMGSVAARSADVVVVTSDNPRSESPSAIVDDIVGGIDPADRARVHREIDRTAAIHHAVGVARDHDVVVIAGKGHETTQTFADRVVDFDDRLVAAAALVEVIDR